MLDNKRKIFICMSSISAVKAGSRRFFLQCVKEGRAGRTGIAKINAVNHSSINSIFLEAYEELKTC